MGATSAAGGANLFILTSGLKKSLMRSCDPENPLPQVVGVGLGTAIGHATSFIDDVDMETEQKNIARHFMLLLNMSSSQKP